MGRYGIKDIFVTLQGEGTRAGTKAVFVRFTGCNLWDGHPLHRERGLGACSLWCDTDFFKGAVISAEEIVAKCEELWPGDVSAPPRWVVLTGGEPCLQVDRELINTFKDAGWRIAIETNGTEENEAVEQGVDWICIAPKLAKDGEPLELALMHAHEIKVVLPGAAPGQPGWTSTKLLAFEALVTSRFNGVRLFVQPQDPLVDPTLVQETALVRTKALEEEPAQELDEQYKKNVERCLAWVMSNPRWSLSVQTHKYVGLQ